MKMMLLCLLLVGACNDYVPDEDSFSDESTLTCQGFRCAPWRCAPGQLCEHNANSDQACQQNCGFPKMGAKCGEMPVSWVIICDRECGGDLYPNIPITYQECKASCLNQVRVSCVTATDL